VTTAAVTGPVAGGTKGCPFGSPDIDLVAHGYREEEFFLEGRARRYGPRPGTDLGRDGRWQVVPVETVPYRTRFVVYRPADARAFNGTVLVSWNNVSAGFDGYTVDSPEILGSGFAYVAVTAQRAGVHGMGEHPMGLRTWDPARYGLLSIPSDDYSYDIFTQAAEAVASARPRSPVDPLGGLDVRRLAAIGGSQSAGRLVTYINAIQPLEGIFDAFLPFLYFGGGAPLEVGDYVFNPAADGQRRALPSVPCVIRDDLDALVMVVNSEVEAIACHAVRQPDTRRFRYWEVAGTAHVSAQSMRARVESIKRDVGPAAGIDVTGINEVPITPVVEAAHRQLQTWLVTGSPPRVQPRIEFSGDPPEVIRDENGIALGGIRLPQVAVPIATNSAVASPGSPMGLLGGSCVPFSPAKIRARYGNVESYLEAFEEVARAAEKSGVLLPRATEILIAEARTAFEKATGSPPAGRVRIQRSPILADAPPGEGPESP
jgi:Alpha/beta hydrolase domain